jgi:predicted TIM-barrel fold metal-dependent hydrolase
MFGCEGGKARGGGEAAMSMVLERPETKRPAETRPAVVDCDIHPAAKTPDELFPFLSRRWQEHARTYGSQVRQGLADALMHPRMTPDVARADAWAPDGSTPGSDPEFMRSHHLDANGVEYGVLIPLGRSGASQRNLDYGAALCSAVNDWQLAKFVDFDPRFRASITVTQEDPPAAVAEIDRRAGDKRFVQILLPPRTVEPLGRRRYWPIFEAAVKHNIPVGLHLGGVGGHATTGSGAPSYYIEEHTTNVQTMQALITSMVIEGLFERFPTLRILLIEGGFVWEPALCWRLDATWKKFKSEVPHLKRAPSEYVREHFCFTTQPIDEPENQGDLRHVIDLIGVHRLLFSTDYPHWDFDDPRFALNHAGLNEAEKRMVFSGNARRFFGLQ